MSVRQYIGARYVPQFSDLNEGIWDDQYSYDALTIVKNGNDFYTSRQPVPVGIAISNTDYWVKTGNYNGAINDLDDRVEALEGTATTQGGQITTLQGQMTTANGNITTLQGQMSTANSNITALQNADTALRTTDRWLGAINKVILVGDSYLVRENNKIGTDLMSLLQVPSSNYVISAAGSTGFAHTNAGTNFLTLLKVVENSFTANDVSHVIIIGGSNDTLETDYDVGQAIATFRNYCRTKFPNAIMTVAFCGATQDATKIRKYYETSAQYSLSFEQDRRMRFLPDINKIMKIDPSLFDPDGVHPTATGCFYLARLIYETIKWGNFQFSKMYTNTNAFVSNVLENRPIYVKADKYRAQAWSNNRVQFNFANPTTITGSDITIGNLQASSPITGSYYDDCACQVTMAVYSNAGANVTLVPASVIINNKAVKVRPIVAASISNVNSIIIPQFNINFDTILC